MPDRRHGGFYGSVNDNNVPDVKAPKGSVLNARILWSFSVAFNQTANELYLPLAARAYEYIVDHFVDDKFGGVYWTVDYKGKKLDDRKQIYALAFCIYGLSEYYKASDNQHALELAIDLYQLLERHAYDKKRKGYYEAFTREWKETDDMRLSKKDANEKKTMNTHLHIVEAYANLYRVWPDDRLKTQIENLLEVFAHHIINDETHHLNLFFDEKWNAKSTLVSYGHDIEAAWLLHEVAEVIGHPGWTITMRSLAVKMADAAAKGLDKEGGLNYESIDGLIIDQKHWWPQAEAMIGFFNAYQVSGNENYLQRSIKSWQFTNKYIKDHKKGEWFWGVLADHTLIKGYYKAGLWKCPYHNTRACLELIKRIELMYNGTD